MDPKEVKACLKAAREAIRNKDFKEALRQCKAILAVEKNNYNALVFVGVAAEGTDQPEQALKAYRRAAQENPDQLLAWQGLTSMLDKNPTLLGPEEASTIFEKLVTLNSNDAAKQITYLHKLADMYTKLNETDKVLDTLVRLLDLEKEAQERIIIQQCIISLLAPLAPKLTKNRLALYKSTLEQILQATLTQEAIQEHTGQLLLLISQETDMDNVERVSANLKTKFPTAIPPIEYHLRYLLDRNIGNCHPSSETCENIKKLITELMTLKEDHPLVNVGQGFLSLKDKNFSQAKEYLQGLATCSSAIHILCAPCSEVMALFRLAQAEAYKEIGTAEAQVSAMALLEELVERMPNEAFLIKAYIFLDKGKIKDAENCAEYISPDYLPGQTLKAAICFEKKAFSDAFKKLQEILMKDQTDPKTTLLLGKTQWELRDSLEMKNARQDCFKTLLMAAKLDPYNYESFLYLGYVYKDIQHDPVKAKRCFQKAFDLCPRGERQGCALVDTLVDLGEESLALKILNSVTSQAAAGNARWAWLRLGLYQMKHDDPTTAITSLQSALRADPNDNHVWECLAEAYLQRGSLTASLKAFTKASELDPDSLYCQYQIATIKHILGFLSEAIQEYKQILVKSDSYVPVLKGVGESLIHLGKQNLSRGLNGLAQDNFEEAIGYLTRAAAQRPDLSCLWKLMGDACNLTYSLTSDSYSMPSKLVVKSSQDQGYKNVSKLELLQVGARCYSQALKILPESGSLWHDLAVNFYYQSQCVQGTAEELVLLQRSTQAIKKSISLEPKDCQHWNVLGILACNKADHKPALAQHCFIKSIECEASNVIAWTNLGALYMTKGDIELAHNAFKAAQNVDPTYVECWIGQALIAEIVGHEEAMDLFRHTTELGFHPESALGYGQWVLRVLGDSSKKNTEFFQFCIHQMAAVPAASDALTRYTGRNKTDPVAYNMQGLLFEHQNLLKSAAAALQNALLLLEQNGPAQKINNVRLNFARVLCKQGRYEDSFKQFGQCDLSTDVYHTCIYGLALFKCNKVMESIKVYQSALELWGDNPASSQIYTALGMVVYKLGDMVTAKSQLFDGFQTKYPSPHGLLALCALGLLQQDITLASAVLDELFKREDKEKYLKDIALLQICKLKLEENEIKGENWLRETVETQPSNSSLWSLLATLILTEKKDQGATAAEYALKALSLTSCTSSDAGKERLIQTLGQLLAGYHSRQPRNANALKTAQKAFFINPVCASSLSSLACAVHAEAIIQRALCGGTTLFTLEKGLLAVLLKQDINPELKNWCLQQLIVTCIEENDVKSAQTYLDQLQQRTSLSPGAEAFIKSVTMFLSCQIEEISVNLSEKLIVLVTCALYTHNKNFERAIALLQQCVHQAEEKLDFSLLKSYLERVAYVSYFGLQKEPDNLSLKESFHDAVKSLKDKEIPSSLALLQAVLAGKDNIRQMKHHLATALDQIDAKRELGYCGSVVRQALIALLWASSKESDQQLIKALMEDAKLQGDTLTLAKHGKLSIKK